MLGRTPPWAMVTPAEELAQLLIVADSQLDVAGDDSGLLVVASGVAGQLEHLGGQVLEDGSQVDGGTGTDALGVAALLSSGGYGPLGMQAGLGGTAEKWSVNADQNLRE